MIFRKTAPILVRVLEINEIARNAWNVPDRLENPAANTNPATEDEASSAGIAMET